jgi:hypothetical protein
LPLKGFATENSLDKTQTARWTSDTNTNTNTNTNTENSLDEKQTARWTSDTIQIFLQAQKFTV